MRIIYSLSSILLTVFILTPIKAHAVTTELPDLGSPDLKVYDQQTETQLGRAFSTALNDHYDLIEDSITVSYIQRIGRHITAETGQNRPFQFYIINNAEINAFAGPNGVIGVHTGLISSAKSEDELASVMAHEIAHVTQRHLSRTYEYQSSLNVANIASLIAAILVGTQDAGAGIATYMGAMGLNIQQQLKNSRIHEREADYFGIAYLSKSGYNPYAMGDFFDRLYQESRYYENNIPEILSTHPVTQDRLAEANSRAYQFKNTPPKPSKETLRLIQIRLHILNQSILKINTLTPAEQCYFDNVRLLNSSQKEKAYNLSCLKKVSHETISKNRLFRLLKADIESREGNNKAFSQYKYLEELYPSDFSIVMHHAKSLINSNQIGSAINLLTTRAEDFKTKQPIYNELAKLYANKDMKAEQYYYSALSQYEIGNDQKTRYLLNQAKLKIKQRSSKLYEKIIIFENKLGSMNPKNSNHDKP